MAEEVFASICIPAYKRSDFLARLLDSILVQTYCLCEVIVTDDSPGTNDQVSMLLAGAHIENRGFFQMPDGHLFYFSIP